MKRPKFCDLPELLRCLLQLRKHHNRDLRKARTVLLFRRNAAPSWLSSPGSTDKINDFLLNSPCLEKEVPKRFQLLSQTTLLTSIPLLNTLPSHSICPYTAQGCWRNFGSSGLDIVPAHWENFTCRNHVITS